MKIERFTESGRLISMHWKLKCKSHEELGNTQKWLTDDEVTKIDDVIFGEWMENVQVEDDNLAKVVRMYWE